MDVSNFKTIISNLKKILIKGISHYGAYAMTLYYIEIINFMFVLAFVINRTIPIILGLIISVAYTIHIIFFYYKKKVSRTLQLIFVDLHAPVAATFIIFSIIKDPPITVIGGLFIAFRILLIILDAAFIYFLTEEDVIASFSEQVL